MLTVNINVNGTDITDILNKLEAHLVSQDQTISDFKNAVQAQFDALNASLDNVAGDVANLLAQIQTLQANAGELTPANAQTLADIVTAATALATKSSNLAATVP